MVNVPVDNLHTLAMFATLAYLKRHWQQGVDQPSHRISQQPKISPSPQHGRQEGSIYFGGHRWCLHSQMSFLPRTHPKRAGVHISPTVPLRVYGSAASQNSASTSLQSQSHFHYSTGFRRLLCAKTILCPCDKTTAWAHIAKLRALK